MQSQENSRFKYWPEAAFIAVALLVFSSSVYDEVAPTIEVIAPVAAEAYRNSEPLPANEQIPDRVPPLPQEMLPKTSQSLVHQNEQAQSPQSESLSQSRNLNQEAQQVQRQELGRVTIQRRDSGMPWTLYGAVHSVVPQPAGLPHEFLVTNPTGDELARGSFGELKQLPPVTVHVGDEVIIWRKP